MNYNEYPGINYSKLKNLLDGPIKFKKSLEEGSASFDGATLGSLVDMKIEEMMTKTKYNYEVEEFKTPGGKLGKVFKKIFELHPEPINPIEDDCDSCKKVILKACKEIGYQDNWNDDTKIKAVYSAGIEQYIKSSLSKDNTQMIVSKKDEEHAQSIVNRFLLSKPWKEFRNLTKDYSYEYQKEMYEIIDRVRCKGKLDLYGENKDGFFIVDFKTTSNILHPNIEIRKYKYWLQAAMYYRLAEMHFIHNKGVEAKNRMFAWVFLDKLLAYEPKIVMFTQADLEVALNGYVDDYGVHNRGLNSLLLEYRHRTLSDDWTTPFEQLTKKDSPFEISKIFKT